MTALPINPTYDEVEQIYIDAPGNLNDSMLAVFQAGAEAERARAAAEATEEWGFNDGAGMIHGGMTLEAAEGFIQRDRRRSIVRRTVGPWEVQP
jgi:hypothetical protein